MPDRYFSYFCKHKSGNHPCDNASVEATSAGTAANSKITADGTAVTLSYYGEESAVFDESGRFLMGTITLKAGRSGIATVTASRSVGTVDGLTDPDRIEQVLIILIDNAMRYTPEGGSIKIKLRSGERLIISVQDNGCGIPEKDLPHIFERFYKVDESHSEESNSFGLGLAIAKSLVDSLCGWIKCDSKENEYTTFTYAIPSSLKKQEKTDNQ